MLYTILLKNILEAKMTNKNYVHNLDYMNGYREGLKDGRKIRKKVNKERKEFFKKNDY